VSHWEIHAYTVTGRLANLSAWDGPCHELSGTQEF
jgi:hypothetical protein